MKIVILLIAINLFSLATAADLDVLFNRQATRDQRNEIAKLLNSKAEKPLPTFEAMAELCYGIDLCAQATDQKAVSAQCDGLNYQEALVRDIENPCYVAKFRKTYSCNEQVNKQSVSALKIMLKILNDFGNLYRSHTDDLYKNILFRYYPELEPFEKDPVAGEEYAKSHPELYVNTEKVLDDLSGLGQYTLDCFEKINPILYSKDEKNINRYYNLVSGVINSLQNVTPYKGMVNRGAYLPKEVLKQHLKVGATVCYNGFTSTAIHDPKTDRGENPSNSFLGDKCAHRLYIKYEDNGAIPGKLIDNVSATKGENEVLFEPGACFRIDDFKPRPDGDDSSEGCTDEIRYDFEMTLVNSGKE